MRRATLYAVLAALLVPVSMPVEAGGPLALIDDFNDGDYTNSPTWTVSSGTWNVVGGALNNSGGLGYEIITTPYTQAYGTWEWRFSHSVLTLNSNKMRFYVMSDRTSLSSAYGYYFISNSGSGTIFGQPYVGLVRSDGLSATFIIDPSGNPVAWSGDTSWHTAKVVRTLAGDWAIFVDGVQYGPTVRDTTYTTSSYIGFRNEGTTSGLYVRMDDITWTSPPTPPSVTLTSPNGGENWVAGTQQTISWNPATPGTYPLKANPISLYYSTTGSGGPWTLIAANLPNTGSYTWTVPSTTTSNAYVKVEAADNQNPANIGMDRSNAPFTISAPVPPSVTVTAPSGGETWYVQAAYDITYTASPGTFPLAANPITIYYSTSGPSGPWTQIAANLPNTGLYNWSIPASVTPSTNAYIKVEARDDRPIPNVGSDTNNLAFTLAQGTPPTVTVTSPNGGEVWAISENRDILWSAAKGTFPLAANPITIYYSTSGPSGPWTQIATNLPNTGSYNWSVQGPASNDSYIKVEAKDDRPTPNVGNDTSDLPFNITSAVPPNVKVLYPNGGETFAGGSIIALKWNASAGTFPLANDPITLWYSTNGSGGPWTLIASNLSNSGSHAWSVPNTPSNDSFIRVRAIDNQSNAATDTSDAAFSIVLGNAAPYLNLVEPLGGEAWSGTRTISWEGADSNRDTVTYNISLSPDGGNSWTLINSTSYVENSTIVTHTHPLDTTLYTDGTTYMLRIDADDHNGSLVSTRSGNLTIDNTPPTSKVDPLPPYTQSTSINLTWGGSDNTSGVLGYDIYVSEDSGQFTIFLKNTTNTSAVYTGREGHRYAFYSVAVDLAGNRENKSAEDTWTLIDSTAPVTRVDPLPAYMNVSVFDIGYQVSDASPVTVALHVRKDLGAWTEYGKFNSSPIHYTAPGEGGYEFYVTGVDAAGNAESKGAITEAETIVDTTPPGTRLSIKSTLINTSQTTVYFDASDNYELAEVRVYSSHSTDNATWSPWVEALTVQVPPGTKSLSQNAKVDLPEDGYYRLAPATLDAAGNSPPLNGPGTVYLRVDTTPPSLITSDPGDGAANVSLDPEVRLTFSEPMNRKSVERATSVSNYSGTPQLTWDSTSTTLTLGLSGLDENSTYRVSISSLAKDLAGNRLDPTTLSFTTVPVTGSVAGTVVGPRGEALRGARVWLTAENGTEVAHVLTDDSGRFMLEGIVPGNHTVHASLSGYHENGVGVSVKAGLTERVTITLQKDDTMLYVAAGIGLGILLAILLLFLVVVMRRRRRCPECGSRVRRGVEACPACGSALHPKKRRERRPRREKGRAETPAKKVDMPVLAPEEVFAPPLRPKGPVKCPSCSAEVPEGEEWCPECGAFAIVPEGAQRCPECGSVMVEGACGACGHSEVPVPALLPERDMTEGECPRCHAGVPAGESVCPVCHADMESLPAAREKPSQAPPSVKAPSVPAGAATPRAHARECPSCGSPLPTDAKWCDICGERLG